MSAFKEVAPNQDKNAMSRFVSNVVKPMFGVAPSSEPVQQVRGALEKSESFFDDLDKILKKNAAQAEKRRFGYE